MNKLSIILGIFIIFSINPLKAAQTEEEQIQQAMRLSLETAEQEQKTRETIEQSRIKAIEIKPKSISQKKEPASPKPLLNLIITLDDTETYDKPIITGELAVACCQAQNPIITLGYSLRVLLDWQQNNEYLRDNPLISDKIWDYYKIQNSDFYLLIPKEYSRNIYYNFKPLDFKLDRLDLDPYEALIGFKIKTESILKKVTADEIKKTVNLDSYNQIIKIEPLFNIFVQGQDDFFRLWNIYLTGHGIIAKKLSDAPDKTYSKFVKEVDIQDARICNLSIEEFRKLISFFNEKIRVNFFYYLSCYAGGYNRILPYITNIINSRGNITSNNKPKFTIATNSTTDAIVPIFFNLSKQCFKKPNQIEKGRFDYLTFFDQLYQLSSGIKPTIFNDEELKKILIPVSYMAEFPKEAIPIESLPQVMLPGSETFRVITLDNDIEVISNVSLNKNILEKKPINSENKRAILIYPQDIPIEVNITGKTIDNFPVIISMTPGISLTKFENLNIETTLKNLIFSLGSSKSGFEKYYYIKKLNVINEFTDLPYLGRNIDLYNVLIVCKYNQIYSAEPYPKNILGAALFIDDNHNMYFFNFKTNALIKLKKLNQKFEFPNILVPYFAQKGGSQMEVNKIFNLKNIIRTLSTEEEKIYVKTFLDFKL